MTNAQAISRFTLAILLVTVAIVVSARAVKPDGPSPNQPLLIRVTGGIKGEGDATHMPVTFVDSSFGDLARTYVSSRDGPLEVVGVRKGSRTLRYYYCDACSPDGVNCCDNPAHDPPHYFALILSGGILEGKGGNTRILFPAGSEWEVRSKEPYGAVAASGVLTTEVIYEVLD